MPIPAYLWLKDDGGAVIKEARMYSTVKEVLKSWAFLMQSLSRLTLRQEKLRANESMRRSHLKKILIHQALTFSKL